VQRNPCFKCGKNRSKCAQYSQPKSEISISNKLKMYNTWTLPILFYGSECWAVTKRDVLKIDAVDQWCLQKMLGIKWYHHVWNDDVRQTTKLPQLLATVQSRRFSLFSHTVWMPDETDAKKILTAAPLENWRRPPGRPHTTWMKTIQQKLKSSNLSPNEARQLTWLRIFHSGDWDSCLVLCTHSGACQKWLNQDFWTWDVSRCICVIP